MSQTQAAFGAESSPPCSRNRSSRPICARGEVISAEVVRVEHSFVVVNAGLKSEAHVPIEEFKNDQGELEVSAISSRWPSTPSRTATATPSSSRDKAKRLASWLSL